MARRTRDVAEKVRDDRRRSRRQPLACAAVLRAGDLTLSGELRDVSADGAFLGTQLLIEIGERGTLEVGGATIDVEVVWLRGMSHTDGPGMGLAFAEDAAARERLERALGRA